jgi:hypothetical protein
MPERPLRPTVDPKDLVPPELYSRDLLFGETLDKFPEGFIDRLDAAAWRELEEIERSFGWKKPVTLEALAQRISKLNQQIETVEGRRKPELLSIIKEMVADNYSRDVVENLKVDIAEQLPDRTDSKAGNSLSGNHLLGYHVYRRELYNSLSQAAGWNGMMQFIHTYRDRLNAIEPGLADKYQELHNAYRYATVLSLRAIHDPEILRDPQLRESISHGREIVLAEPEKYWDEVTGEEQIGLKSVTGVAVGINAWATAHEANKAGFEMQTALEATQRMPLTDAERDYINDRTNSNLAEIRQGIYGIAIDKMLRRSLGFLAYRQPDINLSHSDYLLVVERLFSQLPPSQFQMFFDGVLSQDFFVNEHTQRTCFSIAQTYAIFEETNN